MNNEEIKTEFWMYGPNGEAQIFSNMEDVPKGWTDTPAAFVHKEAQNDGMAKKQVPDVNLEEPLAVANEQASTENSIDIDSSSKKKVKK